MPEHMDVILTVKFRALVCCDTMSIKKSLHMHTAHGTPEDSESVEHDLVWAATTNVVSLVKQSQ